MDRPALIAAVMGGRFVRSGSLMPAGGRFSDPLIADPVPIDSTGIATEPSAQDILRKGKRAVAGTAQPPGRASAVS